VMILTESTEFRGGTGPVNWSKPLRDDARPIAPTKFAIWCSRA
jgi:hypothetical protein